MLSDIASVRIAETYYQDMYLKHLPIPRFKLPEVTIEMPVAVTEISGGNVANSTLLSKMRAEIRDDLSRFLTRALLELKQDTSLAGVISLRTLSTRTKALSAEETALSKRVATSVNGINDILFKNRDYLDINTIPIRLTQMADDLEVLLSRELTKNYVDYIGDGKKVNDVALRNMLKLSRELFFNSVTFVMKQDEVVVNIIGGTTELIKLGDTKYMTTIKITLREQDYEWSIGEKGESGVEERHLTVE